MKTKWMLAPKTVTTAARLTLAFGVVMPAVLVAHSGQLDLQFVQFSDELDPIAGLFLLAFTAFLASHRLRRVDLVNDLMAFRGSMEFARKMTRREGNICDLLAEVRGRVSIWLSSNIERPHTLMRERGVMTGLRIPLREQWNVSSIGQSVLN